MIGRNWTISFKNKQLTTTQNVPNCKLCPNRYNHVSESPCAKCKPLGKRVCVK